MFGELWSELCLAPLNGSNVYGTDYIKMRRNGKGNGKMAKNLCDSRRKNELITGRRIPINIYEREDEVRRKVNRDIL